MHIHFKKMRNSLMLSRPLGYFSKHGRSHLLCTLGAAARGTPPSSRDCASNGATFGQGTRNADHWCPPPVDDLGGASRSAGTETGQVRRAFRRDHEEISLLHKYWRSES